jgi:hypothetical protein
VKTDLEYLMMVQLEIDSLRRQIYPRLHQLIDTHHNPDFVPDRDLICEVICWCEEQGQWLGYFLLTVWIQGLISDILYATCLVSDDDTMRRLIHTEQGTPAQVTQAWDRLVTEEREPS